MAVNKPQVRQPRQLQSETQTQQQSNGNDSGDEQQQSSGRRERRTRFDPRPIVSRHGNTGDVALIAEYFRKQIEPSPELAGNEVIILDHKIHGGILSCILLCRAETLHTNKVAVTVHTYIMECSGGRLPKQISSSGDRGFGGRQLEIDGVAGDVATKKMREERVMNVVHGRYGKGVDIYPAGVSVIPRELAATDEKQLWQVFADGVEAIHRTMDVVAGDVEPFCLEDVPKHMYVRAQVDINPAKLLDSTGLPIRSDLAINISAINKNNNDEDRYDASEVPLVVADAFIDILYGKQDQYQYPNQRNPQTYYANAVVTRIGNPDGAMMLEYLGLGIHAISLLNADMGWIRVFRQKIARENSWRDIGAVGWESPHLDFDLDDNSRAKPEPHQIDITSHNFSESRWFQLMNDAFHPGLIISIDVGETTGDSWLNSVLIEAAEGVDAAYDDVIAAFDNLTHNEFSKCFPVGAELFSTDNNRIAKGYWTSGDEKRPLDDLDYLAALNIWGPSDMQAVADWERTHSEKGGSLQSRIERRLRMQRHVFESEGKMEVKGWSYRLTVNPEVVKALDKAIRSTGVPIDLNDVGDNYGGFSRRSASALSRYVVDPRDVRPNYGRSRRDRDDDTDYRGRSTTRGWSYRR